MAFFIADLALSIFFGNIRLWWHRSYLEHDSVVEEEACGGINGLKLDWYVRQRELSILFAVLIWQVPGPEVDSSGGDLDS